MLLDGVSYKQIQQKMQCSQKTIAKVSKDIASRLDGNLDSIKKTLQTRLISKANKAINAMTDEKYSDADLKAITSNLNAVLTHLNGNTGNDSHTINIQLANMFGNPVDDGEME